ncbi:MAG TPA: FecR domain-containing protein [Pyrinomonadaceae bacterium]|nr:FecR domain-containing protein [Pyrinomonadaceae bacterium]
MTFATRFLVLMLVALTAIPSVFANPQITNLPESPDDFVVDDKYEPEVTARVARFSFIDGDVRIRRSGSEEWENAAINLPVVEGDEISTALGSRAELQFDSRTHLRLDGDSYLRISRLKDEGIAVSLPAGRMSVRVFDFDKDRSYFEVDAPNTTIAFQRSGMYRLDAGREGSGEIRVTALDNGEARVYSDTSGFTLKNGRSSRIFISGNNAGEWETGDASRFADEFDTWALARDKEISDSLRTAATTKYYDNDIYGAEDLEDNGEWIHTRKYGYVWRPYRNVTSRYADWSPYRYGHWRWVPPYGWTWVNDEPWGWATYHYGRWIWLDGGWSWSPYSYYRYRRNWWSPALVVFTTYGGYYAWYPLPYSYTYYNYNYYCYPPRNPGGGCNNNGGGVGPVAQPTPDKYGIKTRQPPVEVVPPTSVVTVKQDKFGIKDIRATLADATTAKGVLTRIPFEKDTAPLLPGSVGTTKATAAVGNDIRVKQPQLSVATAPVKVGATVRTGDAPLDNELRTKRIFGGRNPASTPTVTTTQGGGQPSTGAVERDTTVRTPIRQPVTPQYETQRNETTRPPVRQTPTYTPPQNTQRDTPRNNPQPTYNPPPQNTQRDTPRNNPQPTYNPPPQNTQRDTPKSQPAPVKETPKSSPPPSDVGKKPGKDGR